MSSSSGTFTTFCNWTHSNRCLARSRGRLWNVQAAETVLNFKLTSKQAFLGYVRLEIDQLKLFCICLPLLLLHFLSFVKVLPFSLLILSSGGEHFLVVSYFCGHHLGLPHLSFAGEKLCFYYGERWTCHKSHLFYHMRNGVKTCRWQGTLISGFLVFISETCRSCHPH